MEKKRCIHIETGHIGTIQCEFNSYNPPQFGITWDSGKQIQELGLQYYWQDKNKIRLIAHPLNNKKCST
jgi:hypothetical protein